MTILFLMISEQNWAEFPFKCSPDVLLAQYSNNFYDNLMASGLQNYGKQIQDSKQHCVHAFVPRRACKEEHEDKLRGKINPDVLPCEEKNQNCETRHTNLGSKNENKRKGDENSQQSSSIHSQISKYLNLQSNEYSFIKPNRQNTPGQNDGSNQQDYQLDTSEANISKTHQIEDNTYQSSPVKQFQYKFDMATSPQKPQKKQERQNTQNDEIIVRQNCSETRMIVKAVDFLRQGELFKLRAIWLTDLPHEISQSLRYLPLLPENMRQQLAIFTLIAMYKIRKFTYSEGSLLEMMFEGFGKMVQKLRISLNIPILDEIMAFLISKKCSEKSKEDSIFCDHFGISRRSKIQEILQLIIKERQSLLSGNGRLLMKGWGYKYYLSQFIADKMVDDKQYRCLRELLTKLGFGDMSEKEIMVNADFMSNIEEERLFDGKCLGCAPFFYENMNVLDENINRVPFRVFSSVGQMKEFEQEIKDQICSYLNSGGGIILFDFVKMYEKVIVKGVKMTQKEKEKHEQRFMSYLEAFNPSEQIKKCVKISFVPVVADPFLKTQKQFEYSSYTGIQKVLRGDEKYRLRPYLEGTFVMRIKINPVDPTTVFYWKQATNKELADRYVYYHCGIEKQGKRQAIKMEQISKLIRIKMKKYYLPPNLTQKQRRLLQKPFSVFDHECKQPNAGIIISKKTEPSQGSSQEQNEYMFASLLILQRHNIEKAKQTFRNEGVECDIKHKFDKWNLESASNTVLMYHNAKFEDLYNLIKDNPKFMFAGKPLIIISITGYLKLVGRAQKNPYTRGQFRNLVSELRKQFPDEVVKLYELKETKGRQYYIECESIESTLLAYYLLNSRKEKTMFRNPLRLDKMSWEERMDKFIVVEEERGNNY